MHAGIAVRRFLPLAAVAGVALAVTACSTPMGPEREAREQLATTTAEYRPDGARPALPQLRPDSPVAEFVRYAVLNHPAVEAAFHEWRATVAEIPVARAQLDPQLTFEADIMEKLVTFMPGVMFDWMNSGTRSAMARASAAGSGVAYRNYLGQIQRTALEARKAWIEAVYTQQAISLHASMLTAFDEAAEMAVADYTTGMGLVSLETPVRLRSEAEMHHTEHHATAAQRRAARLRLKSALGLGPDAPNPPWPEGRLTATALPSRQELWEHITTGNRNLAAMRAMVEMTIAEVAVAEQEGKPNFALGLMVDVKSSPLMFRPTGGVSVPIWREKIRARLDAAHARHEAALARVSNEELMLAAELAQMLYMIEEADQFIEYIEQTGLPNLETTLATAAAGYESGLGGATMAAEARAMMLELEVRRLNALRTRELAVADLQLLMGAAH